ncbi:MAG: alanine racemase [Firmicutes bacterium]|nr:alanine racemase [Bacillota bacterium]
MRPVWVDVDLDAVADNLRSIKGVVGPTPEIMAVVKANGYGHGAVQIARVALENGATRLGVATVDEGLELRKAGFGVPILVLGYTSPEQAREVVRYGLTQTVYTLANAQALSEAAVEARRRIRVHLKVETGLGRLGVQHGEAAVVLARRLLRLPSLEVEGIFTHLAAAGSHLDFTRLQIDLFQETLSRLRREGIEFPLAHAANSAGAIAHPESCFDMVRVGIALYGLLPGPTLGEKVSFLRPALSWLARVAHAKRVKSGTTIGYGRLFKAPVETTIATLPLGYADGYSRVLTGKAQVLVEGKRLPVVGAVCMDQIMIDAGALPGIEEGEAVHLIGRSGGDEISADEVARWMGTINYEIVCAISRRVPRVYSQNGKVVGVQGFPMRSDQ